MTKAIQKVVSSNNSRESLIELKKSIKSEHLYFDEEDVLFLISLLKHEDPKARKNVAQILGLIKADVAVNPLYQALEKEEVEYVKSAYLIALKDIDINKIRGKLKALRAHLIESVVTDENRKHVNEQMDAYNALLGADVNKHTFTGKEIASEVLLVTPRGLGDYTADALMTREKKIMNVGVCAKIRSLDEVKHIRTFKEMLFIVPDLKKLPDDPVLAAQMVAKGSLKSFLKARHREDAPWGFRVSLISSKDEKRKTAFIKSFSGELERLTNGYFVNLVSDYELEIRLLEDRDGNFTVMIKLFSIPDERFSYRKEVIAQSIRPELAANIMYIAANYLRSNVQVIDPFCGVGTMLVERSKYRKASPIYGIDKLGEAIEKAKINSDAAGTEVYYVNKDFFEFKHNYPFDEIVTNMPFTLKEEEKPAIKELYQKFFSSAKKLLKKGGYMIIYSRDIDFAREYSGKYGFYVEKEVPLISKENSYLCIYQR